MTSQDPASQDPADQDEVTRAALEAVSEAVQLADQDQRRFGIMRRRRPRGGDGRALRRRDHPGEYGGAAELAERADQAISAEFAEHARRARGIRRLGAAIGETARRGARVTGRRFSAGGRWLSDQVLAMAPRLPVRNLTTLRAQFPGRSPDEVADALIDGAARASAAVGIAVGAWSVLPFLPAAGVESATETLAVVGIEIKLVAELHEVYGLAVPGSVVDRMTAYVAAWAQRRGVSLAPGGLVIAAGSPLARQLQRRLAARAGRSVFSLGPMLTGAAAGGLLNRRETRKLGRILRQDLRRRSPSPDRWLPDDEAGHPR